MRSQQYLDFTRYYCLLFFVNTKGNMRKATQKEFETIQEVFSLNYVKVLFKQLFEKY